MKIFISFLCILLCCLSARIQAQEPVYPMSVNINNTAGKLKAIWPYFGYDEADYTYMKDGRKLLKELGALSATQPVYVRVHNLLTSGNGVPDLKWSSTNAYTEDAAGKAVYDWKLLDSIFDVFVSNHIKPVAEIGFMPEALSVHPQPYRHHWKPGVSYDSIYTGWAYPPTDYEKWAELIYQWVNHCMERYGKTEVESWYWEVWNEPNIAYWKGTKEEYFKLYDYTADAVKRADTHIRIGGPTSTGPGWDKAADFLRDFLVHCAKGENSATGKKGAPLDYITFHAKGNPSLKDGRVVMNMSAQLKDAQQGFEIVRQSAFKDLPVMIGEFDPEGCAACSVDFSPQNAYRNGTLYSSYTAASFTELYRLAKQYNINLAGAVSWSFEFENQPWFAGFRELATNGIDKPVLNVFRMFAMMHGEEVPVQNNRRIPAKKILDSSVRNQPFVDAFAAREADTLFIMLWNYHDDNGRRLPANIQLLIQSLPAKNISMQQYMVDSSHSNSYTLWQKMGSPQQVGDDQYKQLEQAGMLQTTGGSKTIPVQNGEALIPVNLNAHAVTLLKLSWRK